MQLLEQKNMYNTRYIIVQYYIVLIVILFCYRRVRKIAEMLLQDITMCQWMM